MRTLLFSALFLCPSLFGTTDPIPAEFPAGDRIVAIGDLHGDAQALLYILQKLNLADAQGNWVGGTAQLVFDGDLMDRGPETRKLIELVMRLELQAPAAGGHVYPLLGNHEWMITEGDLSFTSLEDMKKYDDFIVTGMVFGTFVPTAADYKRGFQEAFKGESPFANWFRHRNAMVKIGDTLFVHAGLGSWALTHTPAEINTMVRAWFAYLQGAGPKPPSETKWVVESGGPLWSYAFGSGFFSRMAPGMLDKILAKWEVKRIVVGHQITANHRIQLSHPRYGNKVVMIDTAISRAFEEGKFSALEIQGDKVIAYGAERVIPAEESCKTQLANKKTHD